MTQRNIMQISNCGIDLWNLYLRILPFFSTVFLMSNSVYLEQKLLETVENLCRSKSRFLCLLVRGIKQGLEH